MSTILKRYIHHHVQADLNEKMVFLGGPRQVGKTTFAQSLLTNYSDGHPAYLNWDNADNRKRILKGQWPADQQLIILDEVHKFPRWRNLVKGYYDTMKNTHKFLITGSARLDHYRKGGDSLLGRYYYCRLHPFSISELTRLDSLSISLDQLLEFGGFPEPLLKGSARTLRRWHNQRNSRIVHTDIRDLENLREISLIELLIDALPERVGSPLSRKNLANDLEVDFKTVEKWLSILENVYYCYRIAPFGAPKIRAAKKEQKLYLWDWSEIEDPGAKWENLVASHLLKYCHFREDSEGYRMELRFLRDYSKREVDFVVLQDKRPIWAVECKTGEQRPSKHLKYFAERTDIPMFYQVHLGQADYFQADNIRVLPFEKFAKLIPLV